MSDWENIQRQVREKAEEEKRRAAEASKRSGLEEYQLQALKRRDEVKTERWGTAEKAYVTWEYRARKILEDAPGYARELKEDSKKAADQNRDFRGKLIRYEEVTRGFWNPKQETIKVDLGPITLGQMMRFIQHDGAGNAYALNLHGKRLLVNTEIETPQGLVWFENWGELDNILDTIFKPLIAAERIFHGTSAAHSLARRFFEESPRLKEGYSFECTYPIRDYYSTEDESTYFGFNRDHTGHTYVGAQMYALRVPNPTNREEVKDFLMNDFRIGVIKIRARERMQF